ncbi:MAG: NFACT RNA binding domain-containing protein, partial [Erysipelotrichaceae bacterium]
TTLEIDYLESIQAQLDYANFQDALEIRQELVDHKLLAPTSNRIRKSKIKAKPNILQFEVDGIPIYVGKNNLQNDYITFQLARKHHTWFHAKDIHGSHVLVLDEAPSEHVIRTAALLASYYSKARQSSSVPVNYTSVKNLKKPKQRVLGLVYLQNYKTIYIDPEQDLIDHIHKNYLIK